MKYAVSEAGVQAMKAMAAKIMAAIAKTEGLTTAIRSAADECQDTLGPHKASVEEAICKISESLKETTVPANTLAEKLSEVAEAYEEIIENDRLKSTKANRGSTGINGNTVDPMGRTASSNPSSWAANSGKTDLYGRGENNGFVPLLSTLQTKEATFLTGKKVSVFDHPFDRTAHVICNQGSAYPDGPQQTCGCCATGTIINKAGGHTDEHRTVALALDRRLCSREGFTSPDSWIGILNEAGIKASCCSGSSLEKLAEKVENGQGVIIGVSACTYLPESYGEYFPGRMDGHAIALESVIRDASTGEIIEYVVSDSNGKSSNSAVKRVFKETLEEAFRRHGKQAISTNEIIW